MLITLANNKNPLCMRGGYCFLELFVAGISLFEIFIRIDRSQNQGQPK
jgi:hypothetical protein